MGTKKRGGLVERLLIGKEKSEGFARASLPSNRWELFWDIFKGRFGKLVIINLLITLFLVPLYLLFIARELMVTGLAAQYPYNQVFGTGYLALDSLAGYPEQISYNANLIAFMFLPIASAIASIGISGGAYVIRNIVWTEGLFVANDFWQGIKLNFKKIFLTLFLYSAMVYLGIVAISFSDTIIASGSSTSHVWLFYVIKILVIVSLVFFALIVFHIITMTVTYELTFGQLIKNSFYLTIGAFPLNIVFLALGALPLVLFLFGQFMMGIGIIVILLFGISYFLLVWTDYCHWVYDHYINPQIKGAKTNRGMYDKVSDDKSKAIEQYKKQMEAIKTTLNSRPIKPITDDEITIKELPEGFSRKDIEALNESKKAMYEDNERYIEENKKDAKYTQFNESEEKKNQEEIERQKRIAKAKKELAKRNKK